MKKKVFSLAILALSGTMMLNSCIGSYALFNKLVSWETRATNSKFVNAILGFIVYILAFNIARSRGDRSGVTMSNVRFQ